MKSIEWTKILIFVSGCACALGAGILFGLAFQ